MSEVKGLTARKSLRLDCGCVIQAQQAFMVTRIFACPQATTTLLARLTTLHAAAPKHQA